MPLQIKTKNDTCLLCDNPHSKRITPFGKTSIYAVKKCLQCKSEWVDPMCTDETLQDYYSHYEYGSISRDHFLNLIAWARPQAERILESFNKNALGLIRRKNFLDVGGSTGFLCVAMSQLGFDATLQDISKAPTDWLNTLTCNIQTEYCPISQLLEKGKTYSVINASQVLEHLPNPKEFLSTLNQLLIPDGLLFIDTPHNEALLWCLKNMIRPIFNRMDFYNSLQPPQHLWGFTKKGLRYIFEKSSFEILALTDYGLGDPRFQPASADWYPSFCNAVGRLKNRQINDAYIFGKTLAALLDRNLISPLFGLGGGLAAVLRKKKNELC